MTGYTIIGFGAGDEVKVEAEDEVETGEETGRNEGHPKFHGCLFETSFGSGCIYDLNSRAPSVDLNFAWDWTVWIFG